MRKPAGRDRGQGPVACSEQAVGPVSRHGDHLTPFRPSSHPIVCCTSSLSLKTRKNAPGAHGLLLPCRSRMARNIVQASAYAAVT